MDCKLPGDVAIELQPNANVRVGAGLRRNGSTILVVKAGFLHSRIEDDNQGKAIMFFHGNFRFLPSRVYFRLFLLRTCIACTGCPKSKEIIAVISLTADFVSIFFQNKKMNMRTTTACHN